jgi:sigma-E factor negative regulatory protein RseB
MPDGSEQAPRPRRHRWRWAGVALLLASQGALATLEAEQDPYRWLDRMREAARTLNYDGVFVYRHEGGMETIRVIHRVTGGREEERLTSLDGAHREVLRDPDRVTCILSDDRSVVVDESRSRGLFGVAFRQTDDRMRGNYRVELGGKARIAGRDAREVRVAAADEFRYGYRMWLDVATGLLLKSQLLDGSGMVLEELLFTRVELPESIPDSVLQPEVASEGFDRHSTPVAVGAPAPAAVDWSVDWVPPGFQKTAQSREPLLSPHAPVDHLVFTDGLAAFSVYLERLPPGGAPFEGLSQMGALTAFGGRIGEYQVTVIGEVPRATVDRVGRSVKRR